jgi:hypothetical protein
MISRFQNLSKDLRSSVRDLLQIKEERGMDKVKPFKKYVDIVTGVVVVRLWV